MTVDSVAALRRDLCRHNGLSPEALAKPGLSIVPSESRRGSGVVSAYVFDRHVALLADEACIDRLAGFDPGTFESESAVVLDRFLDFAQSRGAERLGLGVFRVLTDPVSERSPVPVAAVDRESADDVARLRSLLDACTDDEVGDAAIDIDDLDPVIRCIEGSRGGELIAYASAFPDEDFGGRWDIGVLTHPEHRGQGLGALAVRTLVVDLLDAGRQPIYRHVLGNDASARLAASLGFERAMTLAATRFADPG